MYRNTFGVNIVKSILAAGTLIVLIQSRAWLYGKAANEGKRNTMSMEGEFYMLIVSTLLGMFMMLSAGHFLLFFIGL